MIRLFIILLVFIAGCATFRAPEPRAPATLPQPTEQINKAPAQSGEIEQPALREKPAEPAPSAVAEPSQEELTVVRKEPSPGPRQKTERPLLPFKEPPVPDYKLQSLTRLAAENDEKILNIYVGMYKKTVEDVMGTAHNPYKHQKITGSEGKIYEVLYYLTREPRKGRPITDRMLTPVIFRKGQVAAIGNYQLKRLIRTGTLSRPKPPKEISDSTS